MSFGRFTPKMSVESLRQKWMAVNVDDPRLNQIGRILCHAAHEGRERFDQVIRELHPEKTD